MELRVLKYFLMIAREENITRAAQRLNVTQPTLSRQLMQMEEELGVKLFKRRKHSISLTEDGILLKQRAQEIINIEELSRELFNEEEPILKNDFTTFVRGHGLENDVEVDKLWIEKKMKRTRLKIDKEIDLYIDDEAYHDDSKFEIVRNGDGLSLIHI